MIFNNEKCVNTINLNSNYFYSENFIDCFPNKVHWAWIIVNIKLPIYLIDRYFNIIISDPFFINSYSLYKYQNISNIQFLRKYESIINWTLISKYQKNLTEEHFIKYYDKLCWYHIFCNYNINIEIINKLHDMSDIIYKNIDIISKTQKLNIKFIIDHISIINPCKLKINNKLDNNIKNKIFMSTQDEKYIFLISKKKYKYFYYVV